MRQSLDRSGNNDALGDDDFFQRRCWGRHYKDAFMVANPRRERQKVVYPR